MSAIINKSIALLNNSRIELEKETNDPLLSAQERTALAYQAVEKLAGAIVPMFESNRTFNPLPEIKGDLHSYADIYPTLSPFIFSLFPRFHPSSITTIYAKCNVGWGNSLYIRGNGTGLSWEKGQPMKCLGEDLWCWPCLLNKSFDYKIVFNDRDPEGWEDLEGNHFKGRMTSKLITPNFLRFHKNANAYSPEEITAIKRIIKVQNCILRIKYEGLVYNQEVIIIKSMMIAICLNFPVIPNTGIDKIDYARKCIEKHPLTAAIFVSLYPDLQQEWMRNIYLNEINDPDTLEEKLTAIWRCCEITEIEEVAIICLKKLGASQENMELSCQVLVKTLAQVHGIKSLKILTGIDSIKSEAEKVILETFMNSITQSQCPLSEFEFYSCVCQTYPIMNTFGLIAENSDPVTVLKSLEAWIASQNWARMGPRVFDYFSTNPAMSDVDRQRALIWLTHFLGRCAETKISPEEFSFLVEGGFIEEILHIQDPWMRYRLTKEVLVVMRSQNPKFPLRALLPVQPITWILLSQLITNGLSDNTAHYIYKRIQEICLENNDKQCLFCPLLKLIYMQDVADKKICIDKFLINSFLSSDIKSIVSNLESIIDELFGEFVESLSEKRELEGVFLNLFWMNPKTIPLVDLYDLAFSSIEDKVFLRDYLYKIKMLGRGKRDAAIKSLHQYMTAVADSLPFRKTTTELPVVVPSVAKMAAELFSGNGFIKDPERDKTHEDRRGQTVAEVQGSLDFCRKVIQCTEQHTAVLSHDSLKTVHIFNENRLILSCKRLGHVFNLEAMIYFSDKQMNLVGHNETFLWPPLRTMFDQFASRRKDLISEETRDFIAKSLSKAVWHDNLSEEKIQEIHQLIHDPSYLYPIIVGSGYVWHSTQIIFFRDFLGEIHVGYCNRGNDCGTWPGIVLLNVGNKEKITLNFLKRIAERLNVDHSTYTSRERIIEELESTLVRHVPMKKQKTGNCVYSGMKAVFRALLILEKWVKQTPPIHLIHLSNLAEKTKNTYKEIVKFDAETVLEDFLSDLEESMVGTTFTGKNLTYLWAEQIVASSLDDCLQKGHKKVHDHLNRKARNMIAIFDRKVKLLEHILTS